MINILNEYDTLKRVILHRPGKEIDRLVPNNTMELLFEDIPFLERMQFEHDNFSKILKENNVEVLYLKDLIKEIVKDGANLNKILSNVCSENQQYSLIHTLTNSNFFKIDDIVEILFAGITVKELEEITGEKFSSIKDDDDYFLINPIPNSYFMRDPAAIVGNRVVSSKMHYLARMRESVLLNEVFNFHPLFKGTEFAFGNKIEESRPFTIEGGDIIVLNEHSIAVGCSERTRTESIRKLATNLFNSDTTFTRVYEINIPAIRSYMHLDTVFTVVDNGLVVAFPNVMNDIKEIIRYEPANIIDNQTIAIPIKENRTFNNILKSEFGTLQVVHTGNNNPRYAAREQLADGTNVFALSPSKVITYERNKKTNEALKAVGVETIQINGSELVRGLGGPRCMTMPILRTK